ncbi:MAG TPA: sulfite exporter TauE/SafE family protein [Methanocorpusculum sp.]|nr:sulfite exporter TauE/SafE family protein [Methanocorpusculum sp.]HJJ95598.1 sulfite exporter TauE/SafE family protein [Methanocorpusculum sp.]
MIELIHIPILLAFGILAGMMSGLLGVGGATIFSPVIYFILLSMGVPTETALMTAFGTSLASALPTVLAGAIGHSRKGNVSWRDAIIMGCIGLLFGFLGGCVATYIPTKILTILFSILLILTAIKLVIKLRAGNKERMPTPMAGGIGAITGFCSGLLGLGGGVVMVPLMTLFGKFSMKKAAGTSAAAIIFITIGGIISYLIHGFIDWSIWICLIATAVPSAIIAVKLSGKFSDLCLRRIFCVMMIVVAVYMSNILQLIPGFPSF